MKVNYRYEGEYKSEKRQKISETVDYIVEKNYGATLLHSDLCKLLGYNMSNDEEFEKYKSTMGRVKEILLQFGRVLVSVNGVGYYILKPSQVSRHCYKKFVQSASRKYDKCSFILHRVDNTELIPERLEELQNMIQLNRQLMNSAEKVLKESAYYSRKDYYNSLGKDE